MFYTHATLSSHILQRLHVIGINHHNAETELRSLFSINKEQFGNIACLAKEQNIVSIFALSTCNRTELYAFAENTEILSGIMVAATNGNSSDFERFSYKKTGAAALQHLNNVAAGLDSKILGDYEILGQLKAAITLSQAHGLIGPIMNRMLGFVIQASKKIKTSTKLSTGTVSVSYAAIEFLQKLPGIRDKKILVIGAGKFGRNVCKNLRTYITCKTITIVNRTNEVARIFAQHAEVEHDEYENLPGLITGHDVLIVCTNADDYTVKKENIPAEGYKLILDLSVPLNADPQIASLPQAQIIDVDYLSENFLDRTLNLRKAALPAANEIITEHTHKFEEWLNHYHLSAHLNEWKFKLSGLGSGVSAACEMSGTIESEASDKAQKAINRLAAGLRTNADKGCRFINAVNDYLAMQ